MKLIRTVIAVLALAVPAASHAQILVAGEGPVVYGHHHLNTTKMAAQKMFFVETLGGKVVSFGSGDREQDVIEFPGVLIFFRPMQKPTGGSIGTTVNHIGFSVPDLSSLVPKIKAAGFKMITSDSVAATVKVTNDIAAASPTTNIAYVMAPEDVKVEFVEVKAQKAPIQLHHIHFFRPAEPRDAGVVREDVRREAAGAESGGGLRAGSAARRVPQLHAVADAHRRHDRPFDRSHRV